MSVTYLLPAKDEAAAIGHVIRDIRHEAPDATILVVDDKSVDGTAEIALAAGAIVIAGPGRGKGMAIRTAIPHLSTDLTIMLDSDYTYTARDAGRVAHELSMAGIDVVVGCRHDFREGSMSRVNRFGNRILSLLASTLYQTWISDLCTGLWGFKTKILQGLTLTSKGFTLEADIFANVAEKGLWFEQIPIEYRCRLEGSEAKLKVRHGLEIGKFLICKRFGR